MNYERITNEYYDSYKEELRVLKEENLLTSLNKIIKTLFTILFIILSILISIYIKNNFSTISLDIREERNTISLSSKLNMTPEEFEVLVELLKSQMGTNEKTTKINFTLSQNI